MATCGTMPSRRALLRLRPSTLPMSFRLQAKASHHPTLIGSMANASRTRCRHPQRAFFGSALTKTSHINVSIPPRTALSVRLKATRHTQHVASQNNYWSPVGDISSRSLLAYHTMSAANLETFGHPPWYNNYAGSSSRGGTSSSVALMSSSRFTRRRVRASEKIARAVAERAQEEAERDEKKNASGKKGRVGKDGAPLSIVGLDPGDAGDMTGVGIVPLGLGGVDGDEDDWDGDFDVQLERGSRRHHRRVEAAARELDSRGQQKHKEVSFGKILSILVPELPTLAVALGAIGVSTFATMQFPNAIGSMIDILSASSPEAAAAVLGSVTETGTAVRMGPIESIGTAVADSASGAAAAATDNGAVGVTAGLIPPGSDKMAEMRNIALTMMGYFTMGSAATFVHSSLFDSVGQKIGAQLRKKLFGTILYSEASFFDVNRAGELANRLSADVHEVAEHLVQNIASFLHNVVRSAGAVGAMILISPGLTMYSSSVIPAVVLCAAFYGRYIKRLSRRHLDALADGTHFSTERFAGIVTVMSFGQRAKEVARYSQIIEQAYALARRVALFQGAFMGTSYFIGNAALLGVLWLGAGFVFEGSMTAGQLASFCMYAGYLAEGVGEITESVAGFLRAQGSGARLFGLLEKDHIEEDADAAERKRDELGKEKTWKDDGSEFGIRGWQVVVKEVGALGELRTTLQPLPAHGGPKTPPALAVAPPAAYANRSELSSLPGSDTHYSPNLTPLMLPDDYEGNIAFENVSFSYPTYPESPVLRDVSLSLKAQEMMAVTGPSGCGKSSLISLLLRFYEPTSGRITLDGVDIRDLDRDWFRHQIGNVPQEPLLFNGSVLDNVRYGKPDADEAEVIRSCEAVGVHRFITSLPESYGTMVGERGTSLSGGQRQRLSVARALLTKPRILALDEATSALDFASERLVFGSLRRLVNDPESSVTSALVLTHHLSVFSSCDHVAVMEDGRVIERGPYHSLRYTQAGGKNQPINIDMMKGQSCQIRRGRRSTHLPWSSFSG